MCHHGGVATISWHERSLVARAAVGRAVRKLLAILRSRRRLRPPGARDRRMVPAPPRASISRASHNAAARSPCSNLPGRRPGPMHCGSGSIAGTATTGTRAVTRTWRSAAGDLNAALRGRRDRWGAERMARVCVIVYTDYAADTRVRRAAEALRRPWRRGAPSLSADAVARGPHRARRV